MQPRSITIVLPIRLHLMEIQTDGHRIHRYQQNEQSPLILTEFT
jgi:hypothetical protein